MNNKHKHLTLADRNDIQTAIQDKKTFRDIATQIKKDPSTVSKEVRKNRLVRESSVRSDTCEECPLLKRAPYVCNACPKQRMNCGYVKYFYYAKKAQENYETTLRESREGVALNREAFYVMDKIVSKAIKKGQRLNHIIACNVLGTSRASIYRYLNKGYLSAKPIDMPRMVKFRPRRTNNPLPPIPKAVCEGRTMDDFKAFLEENNLTSWTEMDTVHRKNRWKANPHPQSILL